MNNKFKKSGLIAVSLAAAIAATVGFAACKKNVPEEEKGGEWQAIDEADAVTRSDFTSVYEKIGKNIKIDMVNTSVPGHATVEYEGVKYELGMDFLSMAMVYNCDVPTTAAWQGKTKEDVYNKWWRLYIERWNDLVPEVPLYSNQYFDFFNATKIDAKTFQTTPFKDGAKMICGVSMNTGHENDTINLGSATELSGSFRVPSFGKSSPGAADLAVATLCSGYDTVYTDETGALKWADESILVSHDETQNQNGTLTYTLEIAHDLKYQDGTAIDAKDYIAAILVGSTKVYKEAGGSDAAGMQLVGYGDFLDYSNEINEKKYSDKEAAITTNYTNGDPVAFTGIRLYSDNAYKFSLTYGEEYAGYYFSMASAAFSPMDVRMYGLTKADIKDDGQGAYLAKSFYGGGSGTKKHAKSEAIQTNVNTPVSNAFSYCGPYYVSDYNASTKTATMKLNTNYKGDWRTKVFDYSGNTPTEFASPNRVQTITYSKTVSETQTDALKTGAIDILDGVTGGDDTNAALAIEEANTNPKIGHCVYDRAGYGKLGFRCDVGPTMFKEVRQAIMYVINRVDFAQTFTGGYGSVVDGPYYEGYSAFKAGKADGMTLNSYNYSVDDATDILEAGGWIYNSHGGQYTEGIRYKKLVGYELTKDNINYASTDGKYKTVKVNDEYYLPLVINWSGTQPNNVTDLLKTSWATSKAVETIGMYVTCTEGDFTQVLYADYCHISDYGWNGKSLCSAANFATGFTSAIYDYAYNWTIDPSMYDDYSMSYLMDEADFWTTYHPTAV